MILSTTATGDVTEVSDNCSTELDAVYDDDTSNLTSNDTLGYILRTWTLTDNCGNPTSKIQTIWIEPTPTLTFAPAVEIICNGQTTNIKIESPTQPMYPVRFDYQMVVDNSDSLQVITSGSGMGLYKDAIIPESFNNVSDRPQRAVITVMPYTVDESDTRKCTGIEASAEVWINPTPRATPSNIDPSICYSANTQILLASPTILTTGNVVKFDYTISVPAGVIGNFRYGN